MPGAVIYISDFQNKLAWKFDISVSWDLKGEIRVFSQDRSLSRDILFLSTNFLIAQSPFEDGIREVSFFTAFRSE
jgi:hypothetical protein